MVGALRVVRWFLLGTTVALVIYSGIWLAVRVVFYQRRRHQKRRKAYLWRHYKHLQKKEMQQEFTPDQLVPLRTLRSWREAEIAYMMVENFFWHKQMTSSELMDRQIHQAQVQPLFPLHEEPRESAGAEEVLLRRHLFITNQRLLLIENAQEESLFFHQIKEIHFYVDTIEMILDEEQRFILHGYLQPEVVVRAYQLVTFLWKNSEKK